MENINPTLSLVADMLFTLEGQGLLAIYSQNIFFLIMWLFVLKIVGVA